MRLPVEASRIATFVATVVPDLTPAQQRGLSQWVLGVLLAGSGCEGRVVAALTAATGATVAAVRQRGREWLRNGADKLVPCAAEVPVTACFAPLLRWISRWWHDPLLPLVLDATMLGTELIALVASVPYRGTALPVAWAILPATTPAQAWGAPTRALLRDLAPGLGPAQSVLVLSDRGFWSPRLWRQIRALGWHPLLRIRPDACFAPTGRPRVRAASLVAPGQAWIGTGVAFRHADRRLAATLVAVWDVGQREPWLLLTDLPPQAVEPGWYGLRMSIEASFASLKSRGWDWQRTRRRDPARVARHWLVLALATLLAVATGTRLEEAARAGRSASQLPILHEPAPSTQPRHQSLVVQGVTELHRRLLRRCPLWQHPWLLPEPWPSTSPTLQVFRADATLPP